MFDAWMWEDAAGEWATFCAFAIAAAIGFSAALRRFPFTADSSVRQSKLQRAWLLALSTLCLLAAGEEISWGQRVFGYMPSAAFQEFNFQQESNLHNIISYIVSPRTAIAVICLGYGFAFPLGAHSPQTQEGSRSDVAELAPCLYLAPWYGLVGITYWTGWPLSFDSFAEAIELVFATVLLVDVLERARRLDSDYRDAQRVHLRTVATLAMPLLLGLLANPMLENFVFGSDPEKVAQARRELEAIGQDIVVEQGIHPDLVRSNEFVGTRILHGQRVGWLFFKESGHFRSTPPNARNSREVLRQRYFLDPWNNAYWLRMKGFERVCIYSFGPNRRLDTVLGEFDGVPSESQLRGDDIAVWIDPFRELRTRGD